MRRAASLWLVALGLGALAGGLWLFGTPGSTTRATGDSARRPEQEMAEPVLARTSSPPSNASAQTLPADSGKGTERPASEDDYLRELAVLRTEDPSRALDWVERGDEWYSAEGRKAEARRASRVTLLVDLGRMDEARRFARGFLAHYPRSEYAGLVRGVTGIHPRPGKPAGIRAGRSAPEMLE